MRTRIFKEFYPSVISTKAALWPISGLKYDSRKVQLGDLFFAVPGYLENGAKYIAAALDKGAIGCIVDASVQLSPALEARCLKVADVRKAMADIACAYFDRPTEKLLLVGVTGTKGKTSTAYLIESILRAAGRKTALLGTVECRHPKKSFASHHTTLEAIDLQSFMFEALHAGADAAVLEVSSHALSLERVRGCQFDAALFTNLSADHMDFYKTMEPYFEAKLKLFNVPYKKRSAVIAANVDDAYGKRVAGMADGIVMPFSRKDVDQFKVDEKGISLTLDLNATTKISLNSPLGGEFSLLNIVGAAKLCFGLGVSVDKIQKGVADLQGVPGRLERVPTTLPIAVFVDFAHTGLALENVLQALRPVTKGRLIALFGAGGDKDPARRTTQGQVAAKLADYTVITSDNPRTEDPKRIIDAIEQAFVAAKGKNYSVFLDRKEAIQFALRMAKPGDVFCLAGKGHETGQIVGDQVLPFDDRIEASIVLRELEKSGISKP